MTNPTLEAVARRLCRKRMESEGGPDSRYGDINQRVDNNWHDDVIDAKDVLLAAADNVSDEMYKAFYSQTHLAGTDVKNHFIKNFAAALRKAAE